MRWPFAMRPLRGRRRWAWAGAKAAGAALRGGGQGGARAARAGGGARAGPSVFGEAGQARGDVIAQRASHLAVNANAATCAVADLVPRGRRGIQAVRDLHALVVGQAVAELSELRRYKRQGDMPSQMARCVNSQETSTQRRPNRRRWPRRNCELLEAHTASCRQLLQGTTICTRRQRHRIHRDSWQGH